MSKWPEKIKILFSSFHKASELSKPSEICWGVAKKKAISEKGFDHSEAKGNLKHKLLNFSILLDTGLLTLGKKRPFLKKVLIIMKPKEI